MIVGSLLLILVAIALAVLGVAGGSDPLLVGSIVASLLAAVSLVVGARQASANRLAGAEYDDPLDPLPAPRVERERVIRQETTAEAGGRRGVGTVYSNGGGTSTALLDDDREPRMAHESEVLVEDGPVEDAAPVEAAIPSQPIPSQPIPSQSGSGPSLPSQSVPTGEPPVEAAPYEDGYDDDEYDEDDPPDEPPAQYVAPADAARVATLNEDVLVIDGRPRYHLAGCVHLLGRESEPLPVSEAVNLGFTPCSLCEPDSRLLAEARRT